MCANPYGSQMTSFKLKVKLKVKKGEEESKWAIAPVMGVKMLREIQAVVFH